MTRPGFEDLLGSIFGGNGVGGVRQPESTRPNDTTRNRMANRQECATKGHKYQVHGKTNPTRVACARCETSWAIGARTEPPA